MTTGQPGSILPFASNARARPDSPPVSQTMRTEPSVATSGGEQMSRVDQADRPSLRDLSTWIEEGHDCPEGGGPPRSRRRDVGRPAVSEPSGSPSQQSPIVRPRTGRAAGIDVGSDPAGAGELGLASGVGVAVAMGAWVPAAVGVAVGVAPGCRNGVDVGAPVGENIGGLLVAVVTGVSVPAAFERRPGGRPS